MNEWELMRKKTIFQFKRIAFVEEQLDDKLRRTPKWSQRWWYLLGQIDITRGQLIYLDRLLGEIREILEADPERPMTLGQGTPSRAAMLSNR